MDEKTTPAVNPKKRRGCVMPIIIAFFVIAVLGFSIMQIVKNKKEQSALPAQDTVSALFEAEQFSRISEEQLVAILGEPTEKEDWTNNISDTSGYKMTTYRYIDGDVCYEYAFSTNTKDEKPLVYMTVIFNYMGEKSNMAVGLNTDIFARLGIATKKSMKKEADTGTAIKWSNVSNNVYEVWAQSISSEDNTVDWIRVKFDPNFPL